MKIVAFVRTIDLVSKRLIEVPMADADKVEGTIADPESLRNNEVEVDLGSLGCHTFARNRVAVVLRP